MLALYYRDLGDLDRAHMYIVLRGINVPKDPDPQIELLYIYAKSGDQKKLDETVQEIIDNYHDNESTMLKLANYATNQGDILLARRVFELAAQNPKFNMAPFCILVIEAFLTVKEYEHAITFIDEIKRQNPPWYKQFESVVESLRAVANYGDGHSDLADIFLTALLKDNTPRPDVMREIANRFYSIGGYAEAQRLLQAAHHEDPNSQSILTQLITVDLKLGSSADLSANIRSLLKMRSPPIDLLQDANRMLGSDRFIFVIDREQLLNELDQYIRTIAAKRIVEE
jgi:tetratricopeptide (TPR) repeat protein